MVKVAIQAKSASKIVLGFMVLLCSVQAVRADECNPWQDLAPQNSVQCADQYSYYSTQSQCHNTSNYCANGRSVVAQRTASSMPVKGTYVAKANLALRAVGRTTLPPTRLTSFVEESGKAEDIYGHEGEVNNDRYASIETGFHGQTAAGLTTGQHYSVPQVSTFPTMAHIAN
jgi:hypothetical protein